MVFVDSSNTVANGLKYRPQRSKGAAENVVRQEKISCRIYFQIFHKNGRKRVTGKLLVFCL
jgi:hypothetical protein